MGKLAAAIVPQNGKKPKVKLNSDAGGSPVQSKFVIEALIIWTFVPLGGSMKVRLTGGPLKRGLARLEPFLAGMILTVSTAYAATVCPLYWTHLQLEADLQNRLAINSAVESWFDENGSWPQDDLSDISADSTYLGGVPLQNPLTGRPYRLDPATHRVRL